jgi:hypothetical protein
VLEVLSLDSREDLDVDLESWTEGIIRHSMLVAQAQISFGHLEKELILQATKGMII